MIIKTFLNNVQINQTIILGIILFIGVYYYGLDISIIEIITTFSLVIFFDFIFLNKEKIFGKKNDTKNISWKFPYSGVNAGFGISFFLRSSDLILYVFAAFLAIFSKHLFKTKEGKHFFNPSNLGVFITLILFPQYAWTDSLQWGNYNGIMTPEYIFAFGMILILGIFICFRVYRFFKFTYIYDLILPFLSLHFLLFFIIPYHETWSSFFVFFSVSFFVFTFFMITDPKTIPRKSYTRIVYAFSLVMSFYLLQFLINENYALLGSLFINTLTLPILWANEDRKFWKVDYSFVSALVFFAIFSILVYICVQIAGRPDLSFDNICTQVFCKPPIFFNF